MSAFSVVLYSSSEDAFYEAVSFAAAAVAQGKRAQLFLRGPALEAYLTQKWRDAEPSSLHKGLNRYQAHSCYETVNDLRARGKIRLYACSAWVRMLEIDMAKITEAVDAVEGLNAFLSGAGDGQILYI
jgi:peroxiredoxin family protein